MSLNELEKKKVYKHERCAERWKIVQLIRTLLKPQYLHSFVL